MDCSATRSSSRRKDRAPKGLLGIDALPSRPVECRPVKGLTPCPLAVANEFLDRGTPRPGRRCDNTRHGPRSPARPPATPQTPLLSGTLRSRLRDLLAKRRRLHRGGAQPWLTASRKATERSRRTASGETPHRMPATAATRPRHPPHVVVQGARKRLCYRTSMSAAIFTHTGLSHSCNPSIPAATLPPAIADAQRCATQAQTSRGTARSRRLANGTYREAALFRHPRRLPCGSTL